MSEVTPTAATRPSNVKAIVPLAAGRSDGRAQRTRLMSSFAATLTPQQIDAVVEFTRTGLQTAR